MRRRGGLRGATGVLLSACLLTATLTTCAERSSTTATTARSTTNRTSSATQTTISSTTTTSPSAANDLTAYFADAANVDQRLRVAAVDVNGSIGTSKITITQPTLDAIAAADPTPAAHEISAGLTPDVLLPVLRVQGDLVSRFYAFRGFSITQTPGSIPRSEPLSGGSMPDAHYLLSCLGNGSEAAASFPAHLAAARAAAVAAPPVAPVDPSSHTAAELAVRLQQIIGTNSGCMSCGGARVTTLAPITWHHVAPLTSGGNAWDGDMGGVLFTAQYTAGQGWTVQFNAC